MKNIRRYTMFEVKNIIILFSVKVYGFFIYHRLMDCYIGVFDETLCGSVLCKSDLMEFRRGFIVGLLSKMPPI